MISLPPFEYSIVIGLMLSDGWMQKGRYNKNARLGLKQSIIHIEFLLWIYNLLSHYCQSLPYSVTTTLNGKEFFGIEFITRTYPCFTSLHSVWYSDRVKVLPSP